MKTARRTKSGRAHSAGTVYDGLKPIGVFVIGDLFPRGKADMDYFRERSTLQSELDECRAFYTACFGFSPIQENCASRPAI